MKTAEQSSLSPSLRPALGGISLLILVALTVQLPGAEWSLAGQRARIGELTRVVAHTIRCTQVRQEVRERTRPAQAQTFFACSLTPPREGFQPLAAGPAQGVRRQIVLHTSLPPPHLA